MARFFTRVLLLSFLFAFQQRASAQITLYTENWTSNSFGTWSFNPSQANWTMGAAYNPSTPVSPPNAYFSFSPTYTNYSFALESPIINATAYINITLDYKVLLSNFSTSTLEQLAVEYKAVGSPTWTLLTNYSNAAGSLTANVTNASLTGMNGQNFQVRFRAYGVDSWNINGWGVDDIVVKGILGTPCSGTPTAGVVTPFGNCPTVLTLAGTTLQANIAVQWQSRPSCGGTWTNITGATNWNHTLSPFSTPTQFRAYVVCTNPGGGNDTSAPMTLTSVTPCYCPSSAAAPNYEDITDVTIGPIANSSPCNGIGNSYTNFSSLPTKRMLKGTPYPVSITVSNCGTFNTPTGVAVFIDYNKDGAYSPAERLFSTATTNNSGNFIVNGTLTIPANATGVGITGMRVIAAGNVSGAGFTGCENGYYYGETEDYLVDIQYAPEVSGTGISAPAYAATYCSGQDVTMTATAPGVNNPKFLWKRPGGGYDTTATITILGIQSSQAGNYQAYVLSSNCPGGPPDTSGARVVNITVNPTPNKPIVAPVIVYCQGDVFDSVTVYGENLKWYSVATGGVAGPAPQINTSVAGTVTYYVSQTVDGCESARAMVTISVAPKPQPPQVESPVGYCQGEPAQPLVATGQNLRWYSVPSGGVGTPIAPTPTTNAQGTFTWYVTQTVAGCESARKPVVVNIGYVPNGLITLSRPFVCQYDTITLGYFGNALPSADYIWTLPVGAQIISGSGQGPLVIRFDSAGLQTVKLNVDNGGCKGPQALLEVPVHLSPKLTIDMPDGVCENEVATLAVTWSTIGIDSFKWDFAGADVVYGSYPRGPFGLRWNSSGTKTVTVVAIDNSCKSLPADDAIDIHGLPNASINVSANNVCAGDSIMFSAVYEPGASYRWQPHQYFGESTNNVVWGVIDFGKFIKLDVVSANNCTGTDSIWVETKPCCQIYFPTAFSPNGDGRNDLFRMLTIGKSQNAQTSAHQISVFRIANRWGQTVFESADERTGWDGNYNGKPQDMGTYHYYVKYKCSDGNFYEDKGELTLVR